MVLIENKVDLGCCALHAVVPVTWFTGFGFHDEFTNSLIH